MSAEVAALRRAGHEVALFAAHTDELTGDRLYPLRTALRVASGFGSSPLPALLGYEPDIVHVHNLFPNFGRRWVDELEVPLVRTLHNYRPLCANGLLLRAGKECTLCPDGKRWAGVRYGCYRDSRLATFPVAWANRQGPVGDPLIRRAHRLIVLSDRQRQRYERAGVPAERMVESTNFVPADLDPGPAAPAVDGGWLFVGRLSAEKGIFQLLEHWPDGEPLTIVGDGPERPAVERRAGAVGASVAGALPRGVVLDHMSRSLGLLFPSLASEVAPLVYPEALAAGLPVVAFEPSTVADAVERDRTGVAIPWQVGALDAALTKVRHQRRALGVRAREAFEARYSEASFRSRMTAVYNSVLGAAPPVPGSGSRARSASPM